MSATVFTAFKGFTECLLQSSLRLRDLLNVCYIVIAVNGFTECLLQYSLLLKDLLSFCYSTHCFYRIY